jgi:catechol 2,3-dioxygenase-like lactoylglutathione lyase family enzyme
MGSRSRPAEGEGIVEILFVASVAVVAPDPPVSRRLFVDTLGLPLRRHEDDDYFFSEEIAGSKHFGVWPLRQAAQACFGTDTWPAELTVPQACFEFEVADEAAVSAAGQELEERGYRLLHPAKTEPWGQTVTRVLTDNGVIIGISYAPWLHDTLVT